MLVDGRWLEMEMKRYEMGRSIGSGNFGVAKLMKDRRTGEKVAVKFLERGSRIDERVAREIVNHRSLRHPNVIRFKEVALTPTYLAIVMEYAPGGDLFELLRRHGPLPEDRARSFFHQLVSGVAYCHSMQICHRDLKLENTLLAGTPSRPLLKICDFGYSKSSLLHSKPNSRVGSPSYIAPEIFACNEYDGKAVDIWSCGVSLYVMLVGRYPFEDENDPNNLRNTVTRIMDVKYRIPDGASISVECRHLLSKIFVGDPARRITVDGIMKHPWLEKEFPPHQADQYTANSMEDLSYGYQSVEEVLKIVQEAGTQVENAMDEVVT